MTRLHDIQLALVISRLYENSMEGTHERTLKTYVLGLEDEPIHEGLWNLSWRICGSVV